MQLPVIEDFAEVFKATSLGPGGRFRASVGVAHEDERRAGYDRRAGADEGDVGVLDLARPGQLRSAHCSDLHRPGCWEASA